MCGLSRGLPRRPGPLLSFGGWGGWVGGSSARPRVARRKEVKVYILAEDAEGHTKGDAQFTYLTGTRLHRVALQRDGRGRWGEGPSLRTSGGYRPVKPSRLAGPRRRLTVEGRRLAPNRWRRGVHRCRTDGCGSSPAMPPVPMGG